MSGGAEATIESAGRDEVGRAPDGVRPSGRFRVWMFLLIFVVGGTLLPVALHHRAHGVVDVLHVALSFFLWLNVLIALWEICLFLRIDLIEEQHRRFVRDYRGRELDRVIELFTGPLPLGRILSPSTWAEIWSSYSVFDESYADRKSFGFFIDVGNGFTTLVPSVAFLYGMTYHVVPARALGIVGLLLFYQMLYGTAVYFFSYVFNRRYRGHRPLNVAIFVGVSNILWMIFPVLGVVASIGLIYTDSYGAFLG